MLLSIFLNMQRIKTDHQGEDPFLAYNNQPIIASNANLPILLQNLSQLPPDLVKAFLYYARPKAVCIVKNNRYFILLNELLQYDLHLPKLEEGVYSEMCDTIASIDLFLDPTNIIAEVSHEYLIADQRYNHFVVERVREGMRIDLGGAYSIYLDTDTYYEAVCTMLKDIKRRLEKLLAEAEAEAEE